MPRTKPGVRVHISVSDHPKTIDAWSDLEIRGMLVELWRKGFEKYAAKRGDKVPLKVTDRMEIAATECVKTANERVERLCKTLKYPLKKYPNRWEVHIRNFAKKQGIEAKESSTVTSTSSDRFLLEKEREREKEKERESGEPERIRVPTRTEPDQRSPPENLRPLLNILNPYDGDEDEKLAWLEFEFPVIWQTAQANPHGDQVPVLTLRYYRKYLSGDRKFQGVAAEQAKKKFFEKFDAEHAEALAEIEREEGHATAHR